MIVVKVELHSAITGQVKLLGVMCIANDGTGSHKRGNYDAWVYRKGTETSSRDVLRTGRVENYPRISYSIWRLVLRALKSCYPEEVKKL